jgi:hypothetical protein
VHGNLARRVAKADNMQGITGEVGPNQLGQRQGDFLGCRKALTTEEFHARTHIKHDNRGAVRQGLAAIHFKVLGVQVERQARVTEQRIQEGAFQMHVKRVTKLVGFGLPGQGPRPSVTGGGMVPPPTPAPRMKDIA